MSNATQITRDMKEDIVQSLLKVQELVSEGNQKEADLWLNHIVDDLSSSLVSIKYERTVDSNEMPACEGIEDFIMNNID